MESAKRRAPTAQPVLHDGIRYEQLSRPRDHGFEQAGGVIAAFDAATDEQLWSVQLYETRLEQGEERDAQEVYVRHLAVDAEQGVLTALDERDRRWRIRLDDRSVTQVTEPEATESTG